MKNKIRALLAEFNPEIPHLTFDAIKALGDNSLSNLLSLILEEDNQIGEVAAWVIGEFRDNSSAPTLLAGTYPSSSSTKRWNLSYWPKRQGP